MLEEIAWNAARSAIEWDTEASFISSHFLIAAPDDSDDTSSASHGGADNPAAGHFWGRLCVCNGFSDLWIANF